MKTEPGYIYELDGQVVVNPEREPDFKKFGYSYQDGKYDKAYAEWKAKNIPVVNARLWRQTYQKHNIDHILIDEKKPVTNGQKVEHIEGKITKIL